MIVAGFELTTIVRNPSSRSTLSAWQPGWSNSAAWPITIGPEPTMQIDSMSLRRGIGHLRHPGLEQGPRVVRAGTGFGMELERAGAQVGELEALDRAVVERDVGDLGRLARGD